MMLVKSHRYKENVIGRYKRTFLAILCSSIHLCCQLHFLSRTVEKYNNRTIHSLKVKPVVQRVVVTSIKYFNHYQFMKLHFLLTFLFSFFFDSWLILLVTRKTSFFCNVAPTNLFSILLNKKSKVRVRLKSHSRDLGTRWQ